MMKLHTASFIIPPIEVQAFAAPIRQKYAPDIYMQGPAHITLFFSFVPSEEVPTTSSVLSSICSDVTPFRLTHDRYSHFEMTPYLAPLNQEPALILHTSLLSAFPEYLPYAGQHGTEFVPHLTLTHNVAKKAPKLIALPPTPAFPFIVDPIHLYLGPVEGNIPWIPVAIIPLGGNA